MPLNQEHLWYAIRVKSNRERVTAESLRVRGFQVCLPLYSCSSRAPRRRRTVQLPLFPGYVFSRFSIANRLPVLTIPSVVHIVSRGRMPCPVEPNQMAAVLSVLESGLPAWPHSFFSLKQRVCLEGGPLAGVEGMVVAHGKAERLIVAIDLLQRSIAVEIDAEWLTPGRASSADRNKIRSS